MVKATMATTTAVRPKRLPRPVVVVVGGGGGRVQWQHQRFSPGCPRFDSLSFQDYHDLDVALVLVRSTKIVACFSTSSYLEAPLQSGSLQLQMYSECATEAR